LQKRACYQTHGRMSLGLSVPNSMQLLADEVIE
jgi:hypothetical protein